IERVFQIFKEAGETKLLRYRGYCSADLSQCSYGGYDGYSFYGKKAKKQLNLVFSQEGDRVDDIIPCKHFVTYYKLEVKEVIKINLSHFRDVFYEINPLERKVQKCAEACKELTQRQEIIGHQVFIPWLVKYSKLYDEVYDHNRYLSSETTAFVNLYYSFLAFR